MADTERQHIADAVAALGDEHAMPRHVMPRHVMTGRNFTLHGREYAESVVFAEGTTESQIRDRLGIPPTERIIYADETRETIPDSWSDIHGIERQPD